MKLTTWAAVIVTGVLALMNLGAVADPDQAAGLRTLCAVLGIAGVAGAAGLATGRAWGRAAVIGVGALNLVAAIVSLVLDGDTGASVTGVLLGVVCVALGMLARPSALKAAAA